VTSPRSSPDRPTNGWALAAFVLAILGGILLSVIFAILALIQLSKGGGQRGRGLAVAALAISAAWVLLIASVIASAMRGNGESVPASDLRVGDCIKDPPGAVLPSWSKRVPCDLPHKGEVYAVLTMPGTPDYPGDTAMQRFGDNCDAEFAKYAPTAPVGPTFGRHVLHPTPQSWQNGDRRVVCIATTDAARSASLHR
jgi:hypothetical protein